MHEVATSGEKGSKGHMTHVYTCSHDFNMGGRRVLCSLFLFCVILNVSLALPKFLKGRPKGGKLGKPKVPLGTVLPPQQWFVQKLDHSNPANTDTWKQRYYVNDTFYKPGGPGFIMIGGEGTASAEWMVKGTWIEYAKKFNALCFQLEHRYYGKSHPTKDMSTKNLQYLSSEQALADLATFRVAMAAKYNLTEAKWITFGGSYPGSLSAWFRMKYPHLVDGAVATSAPMYADLNFLEYLGVVRDSLNTTGPQCNKAIAKAVDMVAEFIKSSDGRNQLKKAFRLCDPIDPDNDNDIANLFENLAGNFENVVQYNKDNRDFEGAIGTNITIDTICGIMKDTKKGNEMARYAAVNSLILDTYKQKCLDYKYDKMIKELKNTEWQSTAGEGGRQWFYQTCTEFGYYQTSDLPDQPFGHKFSISFSVQQCKDIFGPKFTQDLIQDGIRRTNTNYGGFGIKLDKVVFPNGSIDPWHALGIVKDLSPNATAIYIKGTAHCANMYPATKSDPTQLVQARTKVESLITQWLK